MNAYVIRPDGLRQYDPALCAVFLRCRDEFGLLSNFYRLSIRIAGVDWPSSEALYQALRFPENPEIQQRILEADNAFEAKRACRAALAEGCGREDWDAVKVQAMRWTLYAKGRQHDGVWFTLEKVGDRPIVECSYRDKFWGARPLVSGGPLVGKNVLGRLWMERRELGRTVEPARFDRARLFGRSLF